MSLQSIEWINYDKGTKFSKDSLSAVCRSYLDVGDPRPVLDKIDGLSNVLLLSNHVAQVQDLLTAIYTIAHGLVKGKRTPLVLDVFWRSHPALARPANAHPAYPQTDALDKYIAEHQWGQYYGDAYTGLILNGRPSPDPSAWRDSDDPEVLAICARLLAYGEANHPTHLDYPHEERMREALEAGQKLYAQPPVSIDNWKWDVQGAPKRYSSLLSWRLMIDLAIRLGERQTAANLLSQALRQDGLRDGWEILIVPGIYDILPLLAEGGEESNPFFITEEDADMIVIEITKTLKQRTEHGRDWAFAPEKVGWKELLDRLAKGAWKVNRKEYKAMGFHSADDILFGPATEEEIEAAEKEVGELPADFKEMVRIANGFRGGWHLFGGGMTGIKDITIYEEKSMENIAAELEEDGMTDEVAGGIIELSHNFESDGFWHRIIPAALWKQNVTKREVKDGEYRYYYYAPWEGCINPFTSVRAYVASCVEEVEAMVEREEKLSYDGSGPDTDSSEDEPESSKDEKDTREERKTEE